MENTNREIKSTISSEISNTVTSLQKKQDDMIADLNETRAQVSNLSAQSTTTLSCLDLIERKLNSIQQPSSLPPSRSTFEQSSHSINQDTSAASLNKQNPILVIREAKKILGFSPITPTEVERFLESPDIVEHEAMRLAIVKFLVHEINFPENAANGFEISWIFPPASHPTS